MIFEPREPVRYGFEVVVVVEYYYVQRRVGRECGSGAGSGGSGYIYGGRRGGERMSARDERGETVDVSMGEKGDRRREGWKGDHSRPHSRRCSWSRISWIADSTNLICWVSVAHV